MFFTLVKFHGFSFLLVDTLVTYRCHISTCVRNDKLGFQIIIDLAYEIQPLMRYISECILYPARNMIVMSNVKGII